MKLENKPLIICPDPKHFYHAGDTFLELLDMWVENGYCHRIYSKETNHVWLNEIGDVLLYHADNLDWLRNTQYNHIFLGNPLCTIPNSHQWIFWGRHPKKMEMFKTNLSYEERTIESIFMGKVENNVQLGRRTSLNWESSVELFEMPIMGQYKYSQTEYLQLLSKSKFGLCLAGYGFKCNREIELLSMGVVPIITDEVDINYCESLVENVHYLKVSNPNDVKEKINSVSKEKWEEMSKNCIDFYEKYFSTKGSFETTMNMYEKIK
jgi:hypothetical protein